MPIPAPPLISRGVRDEVFDLGSLLGKNNADSSSCTSQGGYVNPERVCGREAQMGFVGTREGGTGCGPGYWG